MGDPLPARFRDVPAAAFPFTIRVFHASAPPWQTPVWTAQVSAPGTLRVPGWAFPVRIEQRLANGEVSQAWSPGPELSVVHAVWWARRMLRTAPRPVQERMHRPTPGDLVVEWSSFRGFDPDGVGRLLRLEGELYVDERWVIEPLEKPDTEQGWSNALFLAVPGIPGWPPGEVVWG